MADQVEVGGHVVRRRVKLVGQRHHEMLSAGAALAELIAAARAAATPADVLAEGRTNGGSTTPAADQRQA